MAMQTKTEKNLGGRGGRTPPKKSSCSGFSVVAIFPEKHSYSYLMYWMISEHLKHNCFQVKEPIADNVGI